MTELKAGSEPAEDPTKAKTRAPQSETQVPYYDLDNAVKVARALHVQAGGVCDRTQLAALLGHTAKSGAFVSRVAAARMFGLVERVDGGRLRVTTRGKAIVAPVDPQKAAQAKVDAFLAVELFRKVHDHYKGASLPNAAGLQNVFENDYGIGKSRAAPAVRIMRRSAESAGFFETAGSSQMVEPMNLNLPENTGQVASDEDEQDDVDEHRGTRPDSDSSGIDPAIVGLLEKLPPGGTPLPAIKRKQLIAAFTSVVKFIYPEPENDDR